MHKLEYYKSKFQNENEQGSDNWLEGRRFAFGGSEMASVLNEDPYRSWGTLIEGKKTKENITQDTTEWGKMFEPVAKIFIEKQKNTTIHDFSSIPHAYYPVCYSPDGLLVEGDDLVLLEIKSPIYRGVNKIPANYLHQVQTGMNVLSVKHCLFAQFRFRRCPIWTSGTSVSYDRKYHKEWLKRCPDKKPIVFGYLYWPGTCDLVDLGCVEKIIEFKPKGKPEIKIGENFFPNTGHILMWKLFDVAYDIILPETDYLKSKEKFLWEKYKNLREFLNEK